jgi:hypothetical protein
MSRDPNQLAASISNWAAIIVLLLLVYSFAAFAHLVPWWGP